MIQIANIQCVQSIAAGCVANAAVMYGITVNPGTTTIARGATCAGNSGASASTSGISHNVNAGPAPNTRRAGRRNASTKANPSVAPHNTRNRTSVMTTLLLVELIDQLAQLGHVLRAQLLVAAEVHQQRRDF